MITINLIKKLQQEQEKLDNFIIKNKKIITDDNHFARTKLALLVEIGELANELGTFKHWKVQKNVDWKKIQEELIDCLHFYLSFTNHFHIDFSIYNKIKEELKLEEKNNNIIPCDLSSQSIIIYNELLLGLFSQAERMVIWYIPEKEHFYRWLAIFEELAKMIGISNETELYQAYMAKNKINWERQNKGY